MSAPTVFISYSHQDKDLLRPLTAQLKALEQAGLLEVWADTRIDAGDKWYPEIEEAMKRAAVAVCLVSEYFLSSDFCAKQEVPFLLKRAADEGLLIVPVLLSECVWEAHRWLKETQMLPGEGQSVRTHYPQNPAAVFVQAAKRIYDKLNDDSYQPPAPPPVWLPLAPELIDRARLPETGSALFGRDEELELLDQAWVPAEQTQVNPTRVLAFTARGGVGKSTLVNHWLAEMARDNYRGATRVFGWSFYSQGLREQMAASADTFIDAALRFFGDSDPTAGSPWDKGGRLAHLVGSERALLVLDGMEPLQSANEIERGKVRDPALESLLRGLARHSEGLCLITTREPVPDIAGRQGVVTRDLEQITPQAGRALLRTARVVGTDAELERLADRFGPNALAVSLLGVYLYEQPSHGIGPAQALEQLPGEKPIDRVIAGFEQRLGGPEREALRLLGFFNRPADEGCLRALWEAPTIPGLTDDLSSLSEENWGDVLERLEKLRLIQVQQMRSGKQFVDAHPLIREHSGRLLKGGEAWREGHRRIYEYLCEVTKEGDEPTLDDLRPLYQAVAHGCQAGLQPDVFRNLFHRRIDRGDQTFVINKLGAFGIHLGGISCFFERQWTLLARQLAEKDKALLFKGAAICLQALGRLKEAIDAMREGLLNCVGRKDWQFAATLAVDLSLLDLTLGEVTRALIVAEQSVTYARRSRKAGSRMIALVTYGHALHEAGRQVEAAEHFGKAEEQQSKRELRDSALYSLEGHFYCDLQLSEVELLAWNNILQLENRSSQIKSAILSCQDVSDRAGKELEISKTKSWLRDIGLHRLTQSRAGLYKAILAKSRIRDAQCGIENAIADLRRAGTTHHISSGLLIRALLRGLMGKQTGPNSAQSDLEDAWEIAERGPMRLHMADIHLYRARLFHGVQPYPWTSPQEDLAAARKLIEQCGYWRRKEELEDAEAAAKNW